jgi:hypothetical protein
MNLMQVIRDLKHRVNKKVTQGLEHRLIDDSIEFNRDLAPMAFMNVIFIMKNMMNREFQ